MKGYVLTDKDIRILIGAAGNAVCEDHDLSRDHEKMIMEIAAEIASKLIGHLSGTDPFSEDFLELMKTTDDYFCGGEDNDTGRKETVNARGDDDRRPDRG